MIDWPSVLVEHDRWLRTVAWSRLRDREAIDEVMQEVALAAIRQASPIADAEKVAPWLYRLTIRQTLLYRRTHGRRRKLMDRYVDRREGDDAPRGDPLEWLLADERRRQVREALAELADRDAEILLLKYIEGWSYRQLAEHLGITSGAVEGRLHRARGRMRTILARAERVGMTT